MAKSIIWFLTPVIVLCIALLAGWGILGALNRADQAVLKAQANAMTATTSPASQPADAGPIGPYPWLSHSDPANTIASRIPVPHGYERVQVDPDRLAIWLRNLPLKPDGAPVLLFNGKPAANQSAHVAVVDIDVGNKDIQQCADAIIRLKAEYLYSHRRYGDIHFNFASGANVGFSDWAKGLKPVVDGPRVTWPRPRRNTREDYSHENLRAYLETVMTYANTASLAGELAPVGSPKNMQIGNIFVQPAQGERYGHAVIVVDMAQGPNGRKAFLLAQGFMPAQSIHVLKNPRPADAGIAPWYDVNFGPRLATPEWTFDRKDLKHFK